MVKSNTNNKRKRRRGNKQQLVQNDGGRTAAATEAASSNAVNNNAISGSCVNVADTYEKVGRVGEGTYGIVYKARDRKSGRYVALKRCLPHHEATDGFPVTTLREIEALRMCHDHPNIVSLVTVAVSTNDVFLVFEYCAHEIGTLMDDHFHRFGNSPFPPPAVKTLMHQLLSALRHVHRLHLIHRDVKVSNLLYTNAGILKLADFGLCRTYSDHASTVLTEKVASLWYRAPELLFGTPTYTQAIDCWAAGCVFAELLQGYPLLNGKTEPDQIEKIFDCLGVPNTDQWADLNTLPLIRDGSVKLPQPSRGGGAGSMALYDMPCTSLLSQAGVQLLTSLLRYDPSKRWTAAQALDDSKSHYFTETNPHAMIPASQMPMFSSLHQSLNSNRPVR